MMTVPSLTVHCRGQVEAEILRVELLVALFIADRPPEVPEVQ